MGALSPVGATIARRELERRLPTRGLRKRVANELGVSQTSLHFYLAGAPIPERVGAELVGRDLLERIRAEEFALADRIEAEILSHRREGGR
jgi:predicted transcriptional regulator